MSNITNAISFFVGRVTWLGEVKSGEGANGPWAMQTFVLTWQDSKFEEQHLVLSASGDERLRKIQEFAQTGQLVKVLWRPDGREYQGRWFGENRVINIGPAQAQPAAAQQPAPGQPVGGYPGMGPQPQPQPQPGYYQQLVPQAPPQPQYQPQPSAPAYQPAPINPAAQPGFDGDIPDFLQ